MNGQKGRLNGENCLPEALIKQRVVYKKERINKAEGEWGLVFHHCGKVAKGAEMQGPVNLFGYMRETFKQFF
jgi:hypothetical protein